MYAVIATGGKQYKVQEGETVRLEKLSGAIGDTVTFDKVLLFSNGETTNIGQPVLENVSVHGKIVEQDKAKKVLVFKYKRRKRFRRKRGHRQPFTAVRIETIEAGA
ncbi:MAG: 50S ribosomal protein L21 [Desulfatibacillaceae bacterium]